MQLREFKLTNALTARFLMREKEFSKNISKKICYKNFFDPNCVDYPPFFQKSTVSIEK